MNFKITKESFLSIFTKSVYQKIIKESSINRGNISFTEFGGILESLYNELESSNYNPHSPVDYVYLHKTEHVARIIPILRIEDECFYYFICKLLEEDIANNRVKTTFGGWRLGNSIKQKEQDDILEIEYVYGSYCPWLWSENWKEFVKISRLFADSEQFNYAFRLDIANFYDCINLNKMEYMLYNCVHKDRQWAIPYLMHFLKYWNKNVDSYNSKSIGLPQTEFGDQSRLLANFYLQDYDIKIKEICDRNNAQYVRYADDQIVFLNDTDSLKEIIYVLSKELNKLGLNLNSAKSKLITTEELAKLNCYKAHDLLDNNEYDLSAEFFLTLYETENGGIRKDTYLKRVVGDKIGLNKFNKINRQKLLELLLEKDFLLYCNSNDFFKIFNQLNEKEKKHFVEIMQSIIRDTTFNGVHLALIAFYKKANLLDNYEITSRGLIKNIKLK